MILDTSPQTPYTVGTAAIDLKTAVFI